MNILSLTFVFYPAIIYASNYGKKTIVKSQGSYRNLRKNAIRFHVHEDQVSPSIARGRKNVDCIEESKRSDFYILQDTSNCPMAPDLSIESQQGGKVTITVSTVEDDIPWFYDDCTTVEETESKSFVCKDGMAIIELQATIHPCSGEYICRTQYAVLCSPSKCSRSGKRLKTLPPNSISG
jgi:hypothetical protein